jgi:hypothetical protein
MLLCALPVSLDCTVLCRFEVDSVASLVSKYSADICRALGALRSGSLQQLLAFVRDVANIMNSEDLKGPLAGFKLESLARLQVRAEWYLHAAICCVGFCCEFSGCLACC